MMMDVNIQSTQWKLSRLGDICEINPSRPRIERDENALTTFVPMPAVDAVSGTILHPEKKPFALVKKGYTYFAEGDVIFAKITPCMQNGKHAIAKGLIDGIGFGSTEFHVIRPNESITAEWIHYYLRQSWVLEKAISFFTGAVGQQRVPDNFLRNLEIPLPPLAEQQRIAAILDEQMGHVARARAAAEEQLQYSRMLPVSYLRGQFGAQSRSGWPTVSFGPLITGARNGLYKPESFYGRGKPILKMYNIGRLDGTWNLDRIDYIELTEKEYDDYRLEEGDILINRVNSRELVGKCAVVDKRLSGAVYESKNIRLRVNSEKLLPEFASFYLNSYFGRRQFEQMLKQIVGMATLNRSDLENFQLPLPPIKIQQEIVRELVDKRKQVLELTRILEIQLAEIDNFPSVLLNRAFNGDLS